jgi:hypothetical protein
MPFLNDTVVVREFDATRWVLDEPVLYRGERHWFEVPAGFETDFASVPRVLTWLLPRYGVYTRAAILHDYLWLLADYGLISRVDADGILRRALRELGVSVVRRWLMWTAVRLGAVARSRSIRELWAGGPWQLLAIVVIAVQGVVLLAAPVLVELVCLALFYLLEGFVYGIELAFTSASRRRCPRGVSDPPYRGPLSAAVVAERIAAAGGAPVPASAMPTGPGAVDEGWGVRGGADDTRRRTGRRGGVGRVDGGDGRVGDGVGRVDDGVGDGVGGAPDEPRGRPSPAAGPGSVPSARAGGSAERAADDEASLDAPRPANPPDFSWTLS